jgi:DNA-binding transcriptional regulator YiaG
MTLLYRNVESDPDAPADAWPAEGIETAMDRGSLSDWRRLAAAIRPNPWGPAARTAETVAGWGEHYGVDALMLTLVRRAREDLDRRGRIEYAEMIRSWRLRAGMTLRELARAAGTSASRLSAYENAQVAPTTDVLGRLRHISSLTGPARASSHSRRGSRSAGASPGSA